MDIEQQLYDATRVLFGWLQDFDRDWQDGWRPYVDRTTGDILFQNRLGSYVRSSERLSGDLDAFARLQCLCDDLHWLNTNQFGRLRAAAIRLRADAALEKANIEDTLRGDPGHLLIQKIDEILAGVDTKLRHGVLTSLWVSCVLQAAPDHLVEAVLENDLVEAKMVVTEARQNPTYIELKKLMAEIEALDEPDGTIH